MKTLLRFFLDERRIDHSDYDWYGEFCINEIEDTGYVVIPHIGEKIALDNDCIPDFSESRPHDYEKIEEFMSKMVSSTPRFIVTDIDHIINLEENMVDVFVIPTFNIWGDDEDDDEDDERIENCEKCTQCFDCDFANEFRRDKEEEAEENQLSHLSGRERNQLFNYSKQKKRNNSDVETLY